MEKERREEMTLQPIKPLNHDRSIPFPRQLKKDRANCYYCNLCGSRSNLRNAKMVWVEDIDKSYKEHYICGYCVVKWERRNK